MTKKEKKADEFTALPGYFLVDILPTDADLDSYNKGIKKGLLRAAEIASFYKTPITGRTTMVGIQIAEQIKKEADK